MPQNSKSQLSEVKRQKYLALSTNKSTSETEGERTSEALQEEILEPPREFTPQPSPKKQKQTIEVFWKEIPELQRHTTA
jgi:uncharacterized damage-inducible protein DinB